MNFNKWAIWVRRFAVVALVTIVSIFIADKYYNSAPLIYESTAKILLSDIDINVYSNVGGYKSQGEALSASKIGIEKELLQSHKLIQTTLNELDYTTEIFRVYGSKSVELYANSPIKLEWKSVNDLMRNKRFGLIIHSDHSVEFVDGDVVLKGRLEQPMQYKKCVFIVHKNSARKNTSQSLSGVYEFEVFSIPRLIKDIGERLDVSTINSDNPILQVSLKGTCPEKNALFVNHLAALYIESSIERKVENAARALQFLNREIESVKRELAQSENTIEQYRISHRVLNIEKEIGINMAKLATMKVQQVALRSDLDQLTNLSRDVSRSPSHFAEVMTNYGANTDLLSNEIVKSMNQLAADKRDLLLVYTPQDPKVQVVEQKINDLSSYLIESIKNAKNAAEIRYNQLSSAIEYTEAMYAVIPEKERQLTMLEREHALLQNSYAYLNRAKIEREVTKAAKISFNYIVQRAEVPTQPIFPSRSVLLIIAGMIGMLSAIMGIYITKYLQQKVEGIESLEKRTSIPVVFTTPHIENQENKTAVEQSVFLNNAVELELKSGLTKGKVLTITAFREHQGKNYNVLQLSKILAKQGKQIVFVDAVGDFAWMKQGEISEHVFGTRFTGINYFGIHSSEFLYYTKEEYKAEIRRLKEYGEYIIINNVYLENSQKALLLMNLAAKNLFVIESGRTSLKAIDRLELLKTRFSLPSLQFILNRYNYQPNPIKISWDWIKKTLAKR